MEEDSGNYKIELSVCVRTVIEFARIIPLMKANNFFKCKLS